MRTFLLFGLVVILIGSIGFVGCTQKADSSAQAIDKSKALGSVEKQVSYLEKQANAFLQSEEYKNAIDVCNYIKTGLNTESEKVQQILKEAKAELSSALKEKLASFGK